MSTPNDNIQHERQRRGLSQRDLARHLGVPASRISRWERGKDVPSPYHQHRLRSLFEQDTQAQEMTQPTTAMTNEEREQQDSQGEKNSVPLQSQSAPPGSLSPLAESTELPIWYPSFRHDRRFILVVLLAVLVVSGLALGPLLILRRSQRFLSRPPNSHTVVGQLLFLSSGQVQDDSNKGIAYSVRLQLQLQHSPAASKQYYAWLLPDQGDTEAPAILLVHSHQR